MPLAIDFQQGWNDAWTRIAAFLPKLVGFLLILIIGYFIATLLARVLNGVLERVGFDRWVERDLSYIDRWSLGLDLKILIRTIPVVLVRTGR